MSIPKLRFPEFSTDPDWQEKRLLDVAIPVEEKAGPNKHIPMSVTAGVGLVSQLDKFGREIAGNAYKNYYVIKKGDFAYNKSATKQYPEGYIARLLDHDTAALPNSIFTCFRVNDPDACPDFFDHLFHDNFHGKWLRKFIAVGARAHGSLTVDSDDLMRMPVLLPKLPEQQKIADCLSSLDDLIAAHNHKLTALKIHKKGLMQQLFPAEGETVPELRFPEFRDKGEWEINTLGGLVRIYGGYAPSALELTNIGSIPYIKVEDMNNCIKYQNRSREYVAGLSSAIPAGSVIFPKRGAAILGNKLRIVSVPFCLDSNMMALKSIDNTILISEFLFYILNDRLSSIADTSSIPQINNKHIEPFTILLPPIDEQQKIADCLSSLDNLITIQIQNIEALKANKKGLMQQLFPVLMVTADE